MNDDRYDAGDGCAAPFDVAPARRIELAEPAKPAKSAKPLAPFTPPTGEEVRRFCLAALRARLALLGVAVDPSTDEATLRRMLRAADGQARAATVFAAPDGCIDPVTQPVPAEQTGQSGQGDTVALPSAEMRRATARHLRERQRVAAADKGAGSGHPRGRGRS